MHNNDFYVDDKGIYLHLYGDLSKLVMSKEVFVEAYKKWIVGEELHWIDNADSYICPVCGLEVNSPARYDGCKCPKCGFQDKKDGGAGNAAD